MRSKWDKDVMKYNTRIAGKDANDMLEDELGRVVDDRLFGKSYSAGKKSKG